MPIHLWPQKTNQVFQLGTCTLQLNRPRLETAVALAPPAPPQGKVKTLYISSTGAEQALSHKQAK